MSPEANLVELYRAEWDEDRQALKARIATLEKALRSIAGRIQTHKGHLDYGDAMGILNKAEVAGKAR